MALRAGDPESIGGYTLERRLGAGGMGTVYLARSESGRRIALKVVHQQFADDDEFRVRFRQEVAAARRVSGAFTAAVVDADPEAERPWMATSYVSGPTLSERIGAGGPLRGEELRKLAIGLTEALRDIHRVGVVHRDLKPANIVLSDEGPRVIDFGISRAADHQTLTMTGRVMGTPPFMSPEQLRTPREVGPESDVFSLAAVLVFAVTSHGPFAADSPYIVAYQVVHEQPSLDEVAEPLRGLIADCLAKDPAARPGIDRLLERLRALPAAGYTGIGTAKGTTKGTAKGGAKGAAASTLTESRRARWVRGALVASGLAAALAGTVLAALTAFRPGTPGDDDDGPVPVAAASLPSGWRPWDRELPSSSLGPAVDDPRYDSRCLVSDGDLYCGASGVPVTRLNAATGRTVWRHPAGEPTAELVGVSEGLVHAAVQLDSGRQRLEAYRTGDGERVWRTDIGDTAQGATFARGRGHAVLTQSWDDETFQAVDARTGDIRWTRRISKTLSCQPNVLGGRPYAKCHPVDDPSLEQIEIYALDPGSGKPKRIVSRATRLDSLGVGSGKLIYLEGGKEDDSYTAILSIDPDSGAVRRAPLPSGLHSLQLKVSLAGDTMVFIRQNGEVMAVTTGGKRLWTKATQVEWLTGAAVSSRRGAVYLATASGRVVALALAGGRELWRREARTDPGGAPADVMLIGDALYGVYGYDSLSVFSQDVTKHPLTEERD
ncbi:protein kinase domain-containing protein [Streptomyces lonegramiae]|uniref:PQQ-binding-like beta-propeller repeat protein n=1 Tax=Streptomyces lonegramiae TaxID=3075524 RepID=A0ABU2XMG6_9ACTN|nr:protein kinase [Streptomyces sp. DSM 41529]MDT0546731.1 PQQ-binding-like beta-propeller repeat protein [Streptomyces sp. DSM 41529]